MAPLSFPVLALHQQLDNDTTLSQALFFPELSRFEAGPKTAVRNLQNSLLRVVEELSPLLLHQRRTPSEATVGTVQVEVPVPKKKIGWKRPVALTFFFVAWRDRGNFHAFVPSLTIEHLADSQESLLQGLPLEILHHLQRLGSTESLSTLLDTQRTVDLSISTHEIEVDLPTPRQRAMAISQPEETPQILHKVATLLKATKIPEAFEVDSAVGELAEKLLGSHARGVLVIGPSGSGKTAVVGELVRRREQFHLADRPFWSTSGSRLMVGADGFGDWQQRCQQVVKESRVSRAVLLLGNLFELAEVARHSTTPQGMAGFFRQAIERGELLCVVECTPEQHDLLERDHPQLLRAFSTLRLEAPDSKTSRAVLSRANLSDQVPIETIEKVERLHRRYARYSAQPGRPLEFLRRLRRELPTESIIDPSQVAEAFSRETGMPQVLIDDHSPLDLEAVRRMFSQEVLGQPRAVDLVIDVLASIKAGLSPEGRPIASLLFIGPTGVGKTETAKTLAQFLFSDRERMTRFDMSEFSNPWAVERLTGGQEGGQGLLTAKVREQPFSVVLFDELEKADPSFFDLLLQILGEGRLTDAHGRLADFTNSVIVMTSNLGALSFSKGPLGFRAGEPSQHAEQEFTRAVKAAFRPELFNRIDRLVPFAPLDRETAAKVVGRELERMRSREAFRSGAASLHCSPEVAAHLASLGFDRRYGARPLKRAIERALLDPLATSVNVSGGKRVRAEVTLHEEQLSVEIQNIEPESAERTSLESLAQRGMALRRSIQKLSDGYLAQTLRNQIQRLSKLEERCRKRPHLLEEQQDELASLKPRQATLAALGSAYEEFHALERAAVMTALGQASTDSELASRLHRAEEQLREVALKLYTASFDAPDRASVIVYAESHTPFRDLVESYLALWDQQGCTVTSYRLSFGPRETEEQKSDQILRRPYGEELDNRALWFTAETPSECLRGNPIGIAFELVGPNALPLMLGESGLHLFTGLQTRSIEVWVAGPPLVEYEPPEGLHLRRNLAGPAKRRFYNSAQGFVEELRPDGRRHAWQGKSLVGVVGELALAELYRRSLEEPS